MAPCNIPMPQRPKVQEELARMESLGVLKPLNESVLREVYPLPRVDDTLAQLTGAKVFSKLDANSGFRQIPLAKKSQHLTTFIKPFGRYCFKKLPLILVSQVRQNIPEANDQNTQGSRRGSLLDRRHSDIRKRQARA